MRYSTLLLDQLNAAVKVAHKHVEGPASKWRPTMLRSKGVCKPTFYLQVTEVNGFCVSYPIFCFAFLVRGSELRSSWIQKPPRHSPRTCSEAAAVNNFSSFVENAVVTPDMPRKPRTFNRGHPFRIGAQVNQ